jgi:class 3 adenylate cyclase/tetratricopeptide (TPR) repeat protein
MPVCAHCGEDNPARARFCLACGERLTGVPPAQSATRRTVTILFCDVVDSTPLGEQLDAEAFRGVQSRYYDITRAALEHHGGTVEKFIGDAVMAVFGIPTLHEDDALRAVRAACELQEAVAPLDEELTRDHGLRMRVRVGLATGEVVAGDSADGQAFATGETVVIAQRLESAAKPGEILITDATYRLVADAVAAESVDPVAAKGRTVPVAAWRLLSVEPDAPGVAPRLDTPLVGRQFELEQLFTSFDDAVAASAPVLVTVIGPAGIGKSRLVTELCARVGDRATTLVGRCLPYGDGITFWPLELLVADAGGVDTVRRVLADEEDGDAVAARLLGAIGAAPSSGEETFWAVRRFLEALARTAPLLVVFEDLHWGEPTFLDLVEYLIGWCRDAPIVLVCTARPELLERRPGWLTPRAGTSVVTLERLSDDDADALVDVVRGNAELLPETRDRIATAAEGNPLFVEQLVMMAAETAVDGDLSIPPTMQALLAARLDRLAPEERAVLERASVIGREFSRRSLAELSSTDDRGRVGALLLSLARKELIRPSSTMRRDEAYKFRHILIRDAAYDRVPKGVRAELHERFGRSLERDSGDEALVGYHFEQAVAYRRALGQRSAEVEALSADAGRALSAAGRRAFAMGDLPAAMSLVERGADLLPRDAHDRPALLAQLGNAQMKSGEFDRARTTLDDALAQARAFGDRVSELRVTIDMQFLRSFTDPTPAAAENMRVAERLIPELERLGDELGLARAWYLASESHVIASRWDARAEALERALEHARRAGARGEAGTMTGLLAQALYHGPTPAPEAIARCERFLHDAGNDRALIAGLSSTLAGLRAMRGDFEAARGLYADALALYEALGLRFRRAARAYIGAQIDLLAGRVEAAEQELRRAHETLVEMGDRAVRPVMAGYLADVLLVLGRDDDARELVDAAAATAGADDLVAHVVWRSVAARLAARGGEHDLAVRLANEAQELAAGTDSLEVRAGAVLAAAAVASEAGREDEARALREEAATLYTEKGNVVAAERVRESSKARVR